jgi:hypothetical protein
VGDYKNQHTITKSYLRGFASESSPNTLWRYEKADGSARQKSVDKATVKFYAYSFREPDGRWNHDVERILGQIEMQALPLLPKLESGEPLEEAEKLCLALLIAVLIRRPAALLDQFEQEIMRRTNNRDAQLALIESMLPELQQKFSPEEIETAYEAVDQGRFDISFDSAKAAQMRVWINSMPRYSQTVASMHWEVWRADRGLAFVTSDAPAFVRRHAHDEDFGIVGITRSDLNAELTFPISKRSLLVTKHSRCKPTQKATKTRVQELNALIIRMAHKHVFAPQQSASLKHLILQNNSFSSPLPDFSDVRQRVARKYGIPPDVL